MDKLTSLNLSFDKILITLVIPGFFAICPWILYALHFHVETKAFLMANNSINITIVACISLVSGLIIENLGSTIEVYCLDRNNKKKLQGYDDYWDKFLQLCYKDEPVGQRYIRAVLLRMKFELSMGIACLSFVIGLGMNETIKPNLFHDCWSKLISYGIPIILFFYFLFWEAPKSSRVLAHTRKLLVDKYFDTVGVTSASTQS